MLTCFYALGGIKAVGFEAILNGEVDELPENAFTYVGTLDEAVDKNKKSAI